MHFEGVIPAALTPFDENGAVDPAALARNTEWVIEHGATGVVGTGTMGEAQSLSASERRLVIETLVEAAAGRVAVTAGVSSETPATSIGYAADAAAALEGFSAGATGWISGVANIASSECVELYRLCREGHLEEAREIYGRVLPLSRLDMRPKLVQFFKAAMDRVGREGGPCRPPRLALTESDEREVEEAVRALGAGVAR